MALSPPGVFSMAGQPCAAWLQVAGQAQPRAPQCICRGGGSVSQVGCSPPQALLWDSQPCAHCPEAYLGGGAQCIRHQNQPCGVHASQAAAPMCSEHLLQLQQPSSRRCSRTCSSCCLGAESKGRYDTSPPRPHFPSTSPVIDIIPTPLASLPHALKYLAIPLISAGIKVPLQCSHERQGLLEQDHPRQKWTLTEEPMISKRPPSLWGETVWQCLDRWGLWPAGFVPGSLKGE